MRNETSMDLDLDMDSILPTTEQKEEVNINPHIQAKPHQQSIDINMNMPSDTQLPIKKPRGRPKGWRKSTGGGYSNAQPQLPSVAQNSEAPEGTLNGTERFSAIPTQKHRGRPKGSKNKVLDPKVVARVTEILDGDVARPGRAARGEEINYNVKEAFKRLREVEEVEGTVERDFVNARLPPQENDTVVGEGEFVAVVKKKDGRGRPKGSKDKDKRLVHEDRVASEKRGRGRPRKGEGVMGSFKRELEVTPIPGAGKTVGSRNSPIVRRSFGGFMGTPVKAAEPYGRRTEGG